MGWRMPWASTRRGQSESALMTSPPALVAMAPQMFSETLSLTNLTEPSRKPTFTPPEWFDWAPRYQRMQQARLKHFASQKVRGSE